MTSAELQSWSGRGEGGGGMLSWLPASPSGHLHLSHHQAGWGLFHSAAPGEALRAREGAGLACSAPLSGPAGHGSAPSPSKSAFLFCPERRGSEAAVSDGRSPEQGFLPSSSLPPLHSWGMFESLPR